MVIRARAYPEQTWRIEYFGAPGAESAFVDASRFSDQRSMRVQEANPRHIEFTTHELMKKIREAAEAQDYVLDPGYRPLVRVIVQVQHKAWPKVLGVTYDEVEDD